MKMALICAVAVGMSVLGVGRVMAHCDTTSGPVIPEAKAALEKGDVTPVLKWVSKANEAEVQAAFQKAVAVRGKGPDAKELADQFFLETLVRLHRAGEGAPYSGIKTTPVEPIVALADKALESGSAEAMIGKVTGHVAAGIKARFDKALEAKAHAGESVEAGRKYVEAYVQYMHYVEGIHTAVMSKGEHHAGVEAADKEHGHAE